MKSVLTILTLLLAFPAASYASALALVPQALPENIKVRAPLSAAPQFAPVGKVLIGNGAVPGSAFAANQSLASIGNSSFPVSIARNASPSALSKLGRNLLRLSGWGALAMLGLDLLEGLFQGDDDQILIDEPKTLGNLPLYQDLLGSGLPSSVRMQQCGWDQNYAATVTCATTYLATTANTVIAKRQRSSVTSGITFYSYDLFYCNPGYYFNPSVYTCVWGTLETKRPATDDEIETLIAQHLIDENRGGDFLEKAIEHNPNFWPELGPVTVSGPVSVPGENTVTTAIGPEGTTVTETQTDYDLGYVGDTITVQQRLKTTITAPNGVVTESTAVSSGSAEATAPAAPEKSTFCEDFPDASACAALGAPEQPTALPEEDRAVSIAPEMTAAGACPAPLQFSILGKPFQLAFDGACAFADGIRPIVLASAWIGALLFLFNIGRSSS
ncbi:exported protein of unknown function [Sterolibacterium denitrificans]|uniref:TspB protein n=1 Tax=Sterolibacterium denitrificans TaxID=157592 RepID=A0A7Z7MVW1_9PROT|nr:virulence factor TspB C-terminal domain-related protein [Sterolibacterium denitrificans]SMB27278.1 exported protein of unknown function [Sterolibacterium denitrificans]